GDRNLHRESLARDRGAVLEFGGEGAARGEAAQLSPGHGRPPAGLTISTVRFAAPKYLAAMRRTSSRVTRASAASQSLIHSARPKEARLWPRVAARARLVTSEKARR